jgi:HptB-dependent secretion and biofilm anti anti-sigma factor
MAITTQESADGKSVIIQISGRFDFATHQEFARAYKQFPKGERSFVVDLGRADYMDSSAMGMLLQLREYSSRDGDVTLSNGNQGVKEILRIANFDKLFKLT